MTDVPEHVRALASMDACGDAVEWAGTQPSLRQAWRVCKRGDWMLWYAARVGADRKTLVLAACDCAELVSDLWPESGREACQAALDTARAWAGEEDGVTLRDVQDAAAAASSSAYAASSSSADAAASSSAYAASSSSAYAASSSSSDAAADAAAAAAACAASAREDTLRQCATIVRRYWPTLPTGGDR
jgi:hypothetical protein